MRLYLSSFRVGDHAGDLARLAPPPGPVRLIGNAIDMAPDRAGALAIDVTQLSGLGYDVTEIDLRDWFERPGVSEALATHSLLWVRGGNTFVLREALRRSGADEALRRLLADDAVAYGGYSAGVCVLTPDLSGIERCDPPGDVAAAYGPGAVAGFTGLAVLEQAIVPHLDSPGHPECALVTTIAEHYDAEGTAYIRLRDGDVLLIDGDRREVLPRVHDRARGRDGC